MKTGLYLTLCFFLFVACNRQDARQEARAGKNDLPAYDLNTWVKADLRCEEIRNADEDDPIALVYLNQLEVQHVLDTVYTCSVIAPQMYTSYGIPRQALSACGGWWAGRGKFYYTLQQDDSVAVMHANPVQADTLVFEYSLLRRFPASYETPDLATDNFTP